MCALGEVRLQEHQNPTRRYSRTSYAHGHTRDTHAEGEGHAALGLGRSAPPTPALCRPPARIAAGAGAARRSGSGSGRGGPASAAPSAPAVGGGEDIVAVPPATPHPRQASPRAPPGAPLAREREWGSVRGREGSNSNLSDLKGEGRPPQIEKDRSGARPRAGTAPLPAPRPPQGERRGTPKPALLPPSLPTPPPALVPPLPPRPSSGSLRSFLRRARTRSGLARCRYLQPAPPPTPCAPGPRPSAQRFPRRPGSCRRLADPSRSGSRLRGRSPKLVGWERGPGAAGLQSGPNAVPGPQ